MKEKAFEILKKLEDNNHSAYIVGGYVRDTILGRKTNDIDICTSATPKEILQIFENVKISDIEYGSVVITYRGYKYDVTTFRKEIKYEKNRIPVKIKYIKNIKKDLLRRDFTINTLCMNSKGQILDILSIKSDLTSHILRTVGNPRYRIKEDSLRILRCIRFATILDFQIEPKTKHYLTKYSYLLKNLSMNRKKEELDKIFLSPNKEKGIKLLIELNLTNALDINKLPNIKICNDIIGLWCQLEVDDIYPFTKLEKEEMKLLRELLEYDNLDNYLLYKYGPYLSSVYGEIKNISKRKITAAYSRLAITSPKDIQIKGNDIANILNKKEGPYIKEIINDIERKIIDNKLKNNYEDIKKYILDNYN